MHLQKNFYLRKFLIYNHLKILYFLEHNKFELSDNDLKFTITDNFPFSPGSMVKTKIEKGEAVSADDFEDVFESNVSPN